RYGTSPALIGLQVINEPHIRLCMRRLLQYYEQAYQIGDRWLATGVKIILSDAFMPRRMAWLLSRKKLGERLVLDIHLYQLFGSKFNDWSLDQHLQYFQERQNFLIRLNRKLPIMIGEWSGALPTRAHKNQPEADLEFIKMQQEIFDDVAWAHCYWSYKKTGKGAWNWRATLHEK